jgi:hypothetical protein
MPTDAYLEEIEEEAVAEYKAEKATEEAATKKDNESKE